MRNAKSLVSIVVILVLTACGSVPPPSADLDPSAASVQTWTAPGTSIAFLPPVGPDVDTSGFFDGASISIRVWALDGRQGVRELHSVPVRVEDDFYLGLWRVSHATRDRTVTRVQVRVFATDLPAGSPAADFCAAQADPDACLVGSFDARIRNSGRNKAAPGMLDVTRARTVPIKVFVPGTGGLRPTSLGELTRLVPDQFGNKVPFDDTTVRNCIVNEFTGQGLNALGSGLNALGSGLNALGSVGGLFLLELGSGGESDGMRLFEPGEAGRLASGLVDYGAFDSAILVVDDFGFDPGTGRQLIYELSTALTEPADGMKEEDLKALVPGNRFSHGALVLHQIVQMVEGAGYQRVAAPWGPEFQVFTRSYEEEGGEFDEGYGPYLVVAAVDTDGFETDAIPGRIRNALGALRQYSDGAEDALDVRRVAINMSFAIVPCEVLEDATMSKLASFGEYLAALGEDNAVADDFYEELTELLLTPLGGTSDPLYGQVASCDASDVISSEGGGEEYYNYGLPSWDDFAEDEEWSTLVLSEGVGYEWGCGGGFASIYVASSGNFGGSFPLYPAAWPLVVGVSSQDAIGTGPADGFAPTKSPFANDGEVMAPGALFELGRSEDSADEMRALGYVGTSFSAPVVSLFTALDLMSWEPRCGLVGTSRLTDAEEGIAMDDPAANANLALDLAVAERCPFEFGYFD